MENSQNQTFPQNNRTRTKPKQTTGEAGQPNNCEKDYICDNGVVIGDASVIIMMKDDQKQENGALLVGEDSQHGGSENGAKPEATSENGALPNGDGANQDNHHQPQEDDRVRELESQVLALKRQLFNAAIHNSNQVL